jgi:hypothetical protein
VNMHVRHSYLSVTDEADRQLRQGALYATA